MRTLLALCAIAAPLFVPLVACSPYSPDLGEAPFLCGPEDQEQRCPDGYTCLMTADPPGVCVSPNGTIPPDANTNANCHDDKALEPNDTIGTAWITPVDGTKSFPLSSLSICPAGDTDTYSMMLTTPNQNLEITVEYEPGGAQLQAAILNSGGTPIANASPVTGMAGTIRAYTPNLPTGIYYAQVKGPNQGSVQTNNYKLNIVVTGP
jgi:hypothetical protein